MMMGGCGHGALAVAGAVLVLLLQLQVASGEGSVASPTPEDHSELAMKVSKLAESQKVTQLGEQAMVKAERLDHNELVSKMSVCLKHASGARSPDISVLRRLVAPQGPLGKVTNTSFPHSLFFSLTPPGRALVDAHGTSH